MQTESSAGLVMGADMSRPPCREKGLSVVVQQDPRCIAFGVAILFAAQGPDERGQAQTAKDQGYWDQVDKNVHHTFLTRMAFSDLPPLSGPVRLLVHRGVGVNPFSKVHPEAFHSLGASHHAWGSTSLYYQQKRS